MNIGVLAQFFSSLGFREAVWFFPCAFMLHVAEELPRFTAWANQHASEKYTFREYLIIHALGIVTAFLAAMLLQFFPNKILIFIFFTVMFLPAMFFNSFFHVGATLFTRSYCPGVFTALIFYPPVVWFITRKALVEGLIGGKFLVLSFIIAGFFHAAEVSRNVFKVW
ncbi:MAG: HXXEE domain-containing protein [Acidobacteriota bacterium]